MFKGWWQPDVGPIDSLEVRTEALPTLEPHQVLIRIIYASINPVDWKLLQMPIIKTPRIPGVDAAGYVHAVGSKVENVSVGDRVAVHVATFLSKFGTFAEYTIAEAHVVNNNRTAYEALYYKLNISAHKGKWIVISGASGSVGGFATQLATHAGLQVIGLASPKNYEHVKQLGAKHSIDYKISQEEIIAQIKQVTGGGAHFWLEAADPKNCEHLAPKSLEFSGQLCTVVGCGNLKMADYNMLELSCHLVTMGLIYGKGKDAEKRLFEWGSNFNRLFEENHFQDLIVEEIHFDQIKEGLKKKKSGCSGKRIKMKSFFVYTYTTLVVKNQGEEACVKWKNMQEIFGMEMLIEITYSDLMHVRKIKKREIHNTRSLCESEFSTTAIEEVYSIRIYNILYDSDSVVISI